MKPDFSVLDAKLRNQTFIDQKEKSEFGFILDSNGVKHKTSIFSETNPKGCK